MRCAWPGLLGLFWLALLPLFATAAEPVAVPRLEARVTDRTGTLDTGNRQRLEILLEAVERDRGAQIAVLLLPTTQPETIEQFSIRLAEAWKIGHKGADNGIIIIVAKNDRKMRIEVGYGLEGAIPDAVAKRIVAERMAPRFKQGDFAGGLIDAAEAIEQAIAGPAAGGAPPAETPTGIPVVSPDGMGGEHPDWMTWLFMLVVGAGILRLMLGVAGSLLAAGIGGWLGFMVFGSLLGAGGAALLIFLLSFVNLLSGGRGGGGGGFSSSSSDSGFSGGGGSFGGGGASGDW